MTSTTAAEVSSAASTAPGEGTIPRRRRSAGSESSAVSAPPAAAESLVVGRCLGREAGRDGGRGAGREQEVGRRHAGRELGREAGRTDGESGRGSGSAGEQSVRDGLVVVVEAGVDVGAGTVGSDDGGGVFDGGGGGGWFAGHGLLVDGLEWIGETVEVEVSAFEQGSEIGGQGVVLDVGDALVAVPLPDILQLLALRSLVLRPGNLDALSSNHRILEPVHDLQWGGEMYVVCVGERKGLR